MTLRDFRYSRAAFSSFSIQVRDSANFLIFNVHGTGASHGIEVKDSTKGRVIGNDLATGDIGIELDGSSFIIVVDNQIDGTFMTIRITNNSDFNTIIGNRGTNLMRIVDGTCNKNIVVGNMMNGAFDDGGTNTEKAHNVQY
ncbi:unnamed protein product [marine sediment metagenome]|uniref:Periplasmic copper-binding protein NosD beta helix domain-containing protein n=1 Tax=marine sediment metagenome TaxID=412755 RepID=X1KHV1_9ZZZZ